MGRTFHSGDVVRIAGRRYSLSLYSDYLRRYHEPISLDFIEELWAQEEPVVIDGHGSPVAPILTNGSIIEMEDSQGERGTWVVSVDQVVHMVRIVIDDNLVPTTVEEGTS